MDIQLTERVEKEPNCFQVRQVSTGNYYTLQACDTLYPLILLTPKSPNLPSKHTYALFQAPSYKDKEDWVQKIKTLLIETTPGLPDKVGMVSYGLIYHKGIVVQLMA